MKLALFPTTPTVAQLTNLVANPTVNWDAVGVIGSLVCLVHCLLLSLAVVVLPWLVLLEGEWLHRGLTVALAATALLAFIPGSRVHCRWLPGLLMAGGLVALNAATFAAPENWETGLTVLGGLFLIAAHSLNFYLCRRCRRCPRCVDGGGCHS